MSNELSKKLNEQLNFEIESAYIYMAMANYMDTQGMSGFDHFFVHQAKEEMEHAKEFYDFLQEMDWAPEYEAIAKPPKNSVTSPTPSVPLTNTNKKLPAASRPSTKKPSKWAA